MGKFSGVLLATDYDDTLYDSKGTISPENRAAIDRFLAEGGQRAGCSASPPDGPTSTS